MLFHRLRIKCEHQVRHATVCHFILMKKGNRESGARKRKQFILVRFGRGRCILPNYATGE